MKLPWLVFWHWLPTFSYRNQKEKPELRGLTSYGSGSLSGWYFWSYAVIWFSISCDFIWAPPALYWFTLVQGKSLSYAGRTKTLESSVILKLACPFCSLGVCRHSCFSPTSHFVSQDSMLLNCRRFGSSKCWSTLMTQSEGQEWERENMVLSAQGLDRSAANNITSCQWHWIWHNPQHSSVWDDGAWPCGFLGGPLRLLPQDLTSWAQDHGSGSCSFWLHAENEFLKVKANPGRTSSRDGTPHRAKVRCPFLSRNALQRVQHFSFLRLQKTKYLAVHLSKDISCLTIPF